jgi:transposase
LSAVTVARNISKETDVTLLQQAVRLLEHENRRLTKELGALTQELAQLRNSESPELEVQLRLQAVEEHLAKLQKMVFGPSSERTKSTKKTDVTQDAPAESETTNNGDEQPKSEKSSRANGGRRNQGRLPLVIRQHPVPESEMTCELCGKHLEQWKGQFDSSKEVHVLQRAFVMVEHQQNKARCPNGCCVKTAPTPRKLFPGARYSIDFALEVAIQKYLYHMPLARQVRQMRAEGLDVDTQTLWDQLNKLATVLFPIYEKILEFVLTHSVVGADETPWRMMNETERIKHDKNKSWQVWTLAVEKAVYYEIQDSRSMRAAEKVLGGYQGTILCDGFGVYEALAGKRPDVVLAFCWAHVRRKYVDIKEFFRKDTEKVISLIDQLFEVEQRAIGSDEASMQTRAHLRNVESRPIVNEIAQWAKSVTTLPNSGLAKAIAYMTNHWSGLLRFLDDAQIPLSNNITERANRDPVLGRKNHYGSRSVRGTEVASQLYSIVETIKLCNVDPRAYLQLAVEAALDGNPILLPHECVSAVASRAEENLRKAGEHLLGAL